MRLKYTNTNKKQEGQVALNSLPESCSKLIYRYLLKSGHFSVTPAVVILVPGP